MRPGFKSLTGLLAILAQARDVSSRHHPAGQAEPAQGNAPRSQRSGQISRVFLTRTQK